MKTPSSWPVVVKQGNATVKIYRFARGKYLEFKVAYYSADGERKFKTFSKYSKAAEHAERVAAGISKGDAATLTLTGNDVAVYLRSRKSVEPLGVALDAAAADYAQAKTRLGKHSLSDAVEFFNRNRAQLKSATVKQVVDDLVESRRNPLGGGRPRSTKHLKDLEGRLGRFATFAQVPIDQVGSDEVRMFMRDLKGEGRTKFNYLRLLRTLFRFAQARRHYPRDVDPLADLRDEFRFPDDSEIEIFTPEEMSRLLCKARPELVPFLALGAFAGLRTAEIERLDWADVSATRIEIKKQKAKTRSRRLIPIQPNLQAWLGSYRRERGPVVAFVNVAKQLLWLAKDTAEPAQEDGTPARSGVEWKHNALRHSFISYRMALLKDENQVAVEAGNSPQMIFHHYRELVSEEDARAWFAIAPEIPANVIPAKLGSSDPG